MFHGSRQEVFCPRQRESLAKRKRFARRSGGMLLHSGDVSTLREYSALGDVDIT